MKHTINHPLTQDLAKQACEKAFVAYGKRFEKYHPRATWTGKYRADIAFDVKGIELEGHITLRKGAIDFDMAVPLLFKPFRAKALELMEEEISRWVRKAAAGELDN